MDKNRIINCKNIIPINASVVDNKIENNKIAVVSYLAKDENLEAFIINRAFTLYSEEDVLSFECLPFAEFDTDYITRKIEIRWLNSCLPRYNTNFQFYTDDLANGVYFYALKSSDNKKYRINISNEIFASLLFIDRYPLSDEIDNDHDFGLAVYNGAREFKRDAKFFIVDKLELLGLADATFREDPKNFMERLKIIFSKNELVSTNIAVKMKLFDADGENVELLIPFDTGVVFDESKFRGESIKDLEEGYLENNNQFVGNLIIDDVKLYGIDKKYTVIRAINKNKESIIILLNKTMEEDLNNKINQY